MKQFNLSEWLQDKSHKIITRDGRPVRIVCWDLKSNTPIIAVIQWNQEREDCYCYNTIGRCANNVGELDLFFVDEEEELTEFDYAVLSIISDHNSHTDSIEAFAKRSSKKLLDLARKELEANYYTKVIDDRVVFKSDLHDRDLQTAYDMGKQDALEDLPKWRNIANDRDFYLHESLEDYFIKDTLHPNGTIKERWVLKKTDLEKLPKEE